MKTTLITLPRPIKGCPAFCTKKNKEQEKENGSTSIVQLAWRSYRNNDEKGREIEEIDMEKEKMIDRNGQA